MVRMPKPMCVAFAASLAAFDASAGVSGQVGEWTAVDAVAIRNQDGIRIVVSDQPFDRAGIAADRSFDIGDTSAHEDKTQGKLLNIYLDEEGKLSSLGVGGSSSYSSDMDTALTLSANTAQTIAGRFELDTIKLAFELPLWTNGQIPRVGAALAADGGEAGKALRAYLAALAANDFDAFVALSPPQWRDSINASKAKGEGQLEIDAMKSELPDAIKIVGGNGEAKRAWVDLSATRDGQPAKAVATLERDDSGWYVRRIEGTQ